MKVFQDDGRVNPKAQWWCGVILVVLAPVTIVMEFAVPQGRVFPLPLMILNELFLWGLGIFGIRQGAKRMRDESSGVPHKEKSSETGKDRSIAGFVK